MGLLDRLSTRRSDTDTSTARSAAASPVFPTKALKKFLTSLTARESPTLLDLGPVVGSNVSFFGEQLGCKILVEDIYAELDRHAREDKLDALPEFLGRRFPQTDGTVDGILCWDIIDYLARPAAQALALQLNRILRPDGALLALFATTPAPADTPRYTKYTVVDETNLMYRPYAALRGRQPVLVNRDVLRLFEGLRVADSFLLQHNVREILFRKPA
ncbi:MAG: class I SAM-dependent methyltransferase [Vicinamibacterales bacterium]